MGLAPAGGWVTFNNIIKPVAKPTASGIIIKIGKGKKYKNRTPTTEASKCPKKIFFG